MPTLLFIKDGKIQQRAEVCREESEGKRVAGWGGGKEGKVKAAC